MSPETSPAKIQVSPTSRGGLATGVASVVILGLSSQNAYASPPVEPRCDEGGADVTNKVYAAPSGASTPDHPVINRPGEDAYTEFLLCGSMERAGQSCKAVGGQAVKAEFAILDNFKDQTSKTVYVCTGDEVSQVHNAPEPSDETPFVPETNTEADIVPPAAESNNSLLDPKGNISPYDSHVSECITAAKEPVRLRISRPNRGSANVKITRAKIVDENNKSCKDVIDTTTTVNVNRNGVRTGSRRALTTVNGGTKNLKFKVGKNTSCNTLKARAVTNNYILGGQNTGATFRTVTTARPVCKSS